MQNLRAIIKAAQDNHYAVLQFNVHTLVNMRAAVEAAAELNSPIIIACTKASFDFSGLEMMIACFRVLESKYSIPMVLHMDHYTKYDDIKRGVDLGIKSVMIDASKLSLAKNIELTKQVVAYAKPRNVSVEAEIGEVGGIEDGQVTSSQSTKNQSITNPSTIANFVQQTEIDILAVGIGNIHGKYKTPPIIKSTILSDARALTTIPFVLHGASGLSDEQLTRCITAGCHKINIGTELKTPFVNALKHWFAEHPNGNDPRLFLQAAIDNIKKSAKRLIMLSMSNNRY